MSETLERRSSREHLTKLQKSSIRDCAQSMRGRPTTLFRPELVNRGRRGVPGSKTTKRSGSVGSRRRICPSHRSWERKIWMLKRVALHRWRVVRLETRLMYGCGILAMRRSMVACAPSSESLKALFKGAGSSALYSKLPHQNINISF